MEKKKKVCNRDRAKPTAGPTDYWGSKPTYSQKKKKKKTKPQYRAISKSLNQKSNPQTKPQYKANQTPIQSRPNPKPNTEQTKPQYKANQTHGHVTRSSLVFVVVTHRKSYLIADRSMLGAPSLIADRPSSQIAELLRCSVLSAQCSCSLPQGISLSLFLSLSLSQSLTLSLFIWLWNENYEMKNATKSVSLYSLTLFLFWTSLWLAGLYFVALLII